MLFMHILVPLRRRWRAELLVHKLPTSAVAAILGLLHRQEVVVAAHVVAKLHVRSRRGALGVLVENEPSGLFAVQDDNRLTHDSDGADRAVALFVLEPVLELWHPRRWHVEKVADEGETRRTGWKDMSSTTFAREEEPAGEKQRDEDGRNKNCRTCPKNSKTGQGGHPDQDS